MLDPRKKLISFRQAVGEADRRIEPAAAVTAQPIPYMLETIPNARFDEGIAEGRRIARRRYRFHPNEIAPAVEFIHHLRRSAHKILIGHPMQSGKTNIIACIMVLLRQLLKANGNQVVRGVYICANNQLDLRNQAIKFLAHHMEVLALKDRKKWQDTSAAPVIVFFDESHFGDGSSMTIYKFLQAHNVLFDDAHKMIFCGVSATPFTSVGPEVMDARVMADLSLLESRSYNSVGIMLERGRIVEAEPLIVDENGQHPSAKDSRDPSKIYLNPDANVFRHIERILQGDAISGYCMIRSASVLHAEMIRSWLEGHWGSKVYVVMWNQHHRTFTPDNFFSDDRPDKLTVVLVQHKARMGNQIDTQHCHFMYEMPAVSSKVDTISQSFIGRACGFGKQEHTAIVYSSVAVAEIYDAFMGRTQDMPKFFDLCDQHGRKASLRAEDAVQDDSYLLDHIETIEFERGKNYRRQIDTHVLALKKKYAHLTQGRGTVRLYSRWSPPEQRTRTDGHGLIACRSEPGSWAIAVNDRKFEGQGAQRKMVPNKIIRAALYVRSHVKPKVQPRMLRPKESSFFSHIVDDNRAVAAGLPRPTQLIQASLPGTLAPQMSGPTAGMEIANTFRLPEHLSI